MRFEEGDYIYKEGEEILEIYFLVKGAACYVLPRFDNKIYLEIFQGDHFGHVDLGGERDFLKFQKQPRKAVLLNKDLLIRKFTV